MNGNMVQITAENADALGFEISEPDTNAPSGDLEQQIWDQLKTCYDPEIPVNIVELGLIYDLNIEDVEEGKNIGIKMTLTAPGCGMGPVIADEVDRKVNGIDGINNVSVELVWEPMWTRDMMSEEAQLELGMLQMEFSLKDIKQDFPIFHNSDLVYLDSASTTQKPQVVLDSISSMYSEANANVHRALYSLGSVATERYENSRTKEKKVPQILNLCWMLNAGC